MPVTAGAFQMRGKFILGPSFIRLAFRNICRARIRTILTLIGIGGSICLYVSLTAISTDLKRQLDQAITHNNVDIIVQEKGSATPVASRIPLPDVYDIEQFERIKATSSIVVGSVKTKGTPYLFLFGVSSTKPYLSLTNWLGNGIIDGTMFTPGKKQILLGRLAAKRTKKKVGDIIVLGADETYHVSGIYWLGQGILDGGAVVDLATSQALFKRKGYVNMIMVELQDKKETAKMIHKMSKAFPKLSVTPASSLRSQIRAISMIDGFIAAVIFTALLLSGILTLNTLLMAISERTREIGVLMAIGWTRLMIIRLIITEAVILGGLGGIIGYGFSFPALHILKLLPAMGPGWVPVTPSPGLFFTAIGLASGIAGLSALYPAFFATRLQPAAALRYE